MTTHFPSLDRALDTLRDGPSSVVNIGGVYYDRASINRNLRGDIARMLVELQLDPDRHMNALESLALQVIMKSMGEKV